MLCIRVVFLRNVTDMEEDDGDCFPFVWGLQDRTRIGGKDIEGCRSIGDRYRMENTEMQNLFQDKNVVLVLR